MRSVFTRLAVLSLAAGAVTVGAVGCSTSKDSPDTRPTDTAPTTTSEFGSVGLNLRVAPGEDAIVPTIHYVVSQNGTPVNDTLQPEPMVGDIPVPTGETDFVYALSLPVGTGYAIAMTADWDDPDDADSAIDIHCQGSTPSFDITYSSDTAVPAVMTCIDVGSGNVIVGVDVTSTACPDLHPQYASAIPRTITLGQVTEVRSLFIEDNAQAITYTWSVAPAAAGNFVYPDPMARNNAQFNCTTASAPNTPHVLTITAASGGCQDTLNVTVTCASALCGNSIPTDPGETCDDGPLNGQPGYCPADCNQVCGDNNREGTEACDFDSVANPMGTPDCQLGCTPRPVVCGDNWRHSTEACDDGNTVSGDGCDYPSCTATPQVCGDGARTGAEECDPGPPPSVATPGCSDDCQELATAACLTCESTACATYTDACNTALQAVDLGTWPNTLALCNDVVQCIHDTKCAVTSPVSCFCGNLSVPQCQAVAPGSAPGPCAGVISAALGSNDPNFFLTTGTSVTLPGGWAMRRAYCWQGNCNAACLQ